MLCLSSSRVDDRKMSEAERGLEIKIQKRPLHLLKKIKKIKNRLTLLGERKNNQSISVQEQSEHHYSRTIRASLFESNQRISMQKHFSA
jgi:hypothetical protein